MAQKFELSLSVDYVNNWGTWEAVREIWQNALDFNNYTHTWTSHELDNKPNVLRITSKDVALEKDTLLLGKSTKANDKKTIGQFGEGYKLACLVLARMGKKVTIYNACRNEIWRPRIVKSRRYKAEILTMFVEKHIYDDMYNDDLTFEIEGITADEWLEISDKNLHIGGRLGRLNKIETDKGDILLRLYESEDCDVIPTKPTVYVNGLYVSEIPVGGYRYSYNIKPRFIELDRDRGCIRGFDFKWLTSQMWTSQFDIKHEVIIKMIEQKIPDVAFIDSHIGNNRNDVAEDFIRKHGDRAIAVSNDHEYKTIKREHGSLAKPVIVSETYNNILNDSSVYKESVKAIPIRKQGVAKKSPRILIKDEYNKLHEDLLLDDCLDREDIKELVAKSFNKLLGMSTNWRWK